MSELGPVEHVVLRRHEPVTSLRFACNEDYALYAIEVDYAAQVWWLALGWWPVIAGAVVLLGFVGATWRVRRRWRASAVAARAPHCRHCRGALERADAAACPRCDRALGRGDLYFRRPFSYARAMVLLGTPVVLGFLIVLTLATVGPYNPYVLSLEDRFDIRSSGLVPWLVRSGQLNFIVPTSRLVRLDVDTGERQVVHEKDMAFATRIGWRQCRPNHLYLMGGGLVILPDGEADAVAAPRPVERRDNQASNYIVARDGESLRYVDRDGQVHERSAEGEEANWQPVGEPLQGFNAMADEEELVHVGRAAEGALWATRDSRLYRHWNIEDGSLRHSVRIRGGELAGSVRPHQAQVSYVVTWDASSEAYGPVELWDFDEGVFHGELRGPDGDSIASLTASPGGRYLYAVAGEAPYSVHVRDLEADAWVAELPTPAGSAGVGESRVNRVGDRLAAVLWVEDQARIVTWDIGAWADPYEAEADES